MSKRTLFISDLHLEPESPQRTDLFLSFLENQATDADALYILGDFFNAWIGDADKSKFATLIKDKLAHYVQRHAPVYFIRGNHDFLINKRFCKYTGVVRLEDESTIDLYGTKTLLLHGDSLMTHDQKFQDFRKKIYSPFCQFLWQLRTLKRRRSAVAEWRAKSKTHKAKISDQLLDVHPPEVEAFFKKFQTPIMIHGHTHKPNIHELKINNQQYKRIVLDSWYAHGNYLEYFKDGSCELINF